jgi:predicted nucleotidyltransferase
MQLAELKALAPQIDVLLAQYGACNLAVFGSVARDQARAGSDVDLIRRRNLKRSLRQRVGAEAVALR